MFLPWRRRRALRLPAHLAVQLSRAPWHPLIAADDARSVALMDPVARGPMPSDTPIAFQLVAVPEAWVVRFRYLGGPESTRVVVLGSGYALEGRHSGRMFQLQGRGSDTALVQALGDWLSSSTPASSHHRTALGMVRLLLARRWASLVYPQGRTLEVAARRAGSS